MRTVGIVLLAVAAVSLTAEQAANRPPSISDMDQQEADLNKQIEDLSKKLYDTPIPPVQPDEGFRGVELLGIKQEGFAAGGWGGFYGKNYDQLNDRYQQASKQYRTVSVEREQCEQEFRMATGNVADLQKKIADRTSDLERIAKGLESASQPPSDAERIRKLTADQERYQNELREAQSRLPAEQSRLAAAESKLPGLRSQEESARTAANTTRGPLVEEETRLYKKWITEPSQ